MKKKRPMRKMTPEERADLERVRAMLRERIAYYEKKLGPWKPQSG
jgi:hypothetical protein